MHKILSLIAVLGLLSACGSAKRSAKSASYGGAFERNQTTQPTAVVSAKTDSSQLRATTEQTHALITPIEKNRSFTGHKAWHRFQAQSITLAPGADTTKPEPKEKPILKEAKIGFWLTIGGASAPIITSVLNAALSNTQVETLQIIFSMVGVLSLLALIGGLVLGIIALKKMKEEPNTYRGYGMALTSVILPSVYLVLALLYVLFIILLLMLLFGL